MGKAKLEVNPSPGKVKFDREVHKRMVLEKYARTERPIMVGPVTMLPGWKAPLEDTEKLLDEMVEDGVLRDATDAEKHKFDVQLGYFPVRAKKPRSIPPKSR